MFPKITTVIPTYQRAKLLARAIRSILRQTYPHFEIIVCDNCSSDETREVVEEFAREDSRIRYFRHSENIGMLGNWNFALKQVETPFFSILCDDDILLPTFYEETLKGFDSFPDAMMVAATSLIINYEAKRFVNYAPASDSKRGYLSAPSGLFEMATKQHPATTTVVFRREVIDEFGGLDAETAALADINQMMRIAARYPIVVSDEICGLYILQSSGYCQENGMFHVYHPSCLKVLKNITTDKKVKWLTRFLFTQSYTRNIMLATCHWKQTFLAQEDAENTKKAQQAMESLIQANKLASIYRIEADVKARLKSSWLGSIIRRAKKSAHSFRADTAKTITANSDDKMTNYLNYLKS